VSVPFLDVRAGYLELREEIDSAFARVMDSGSYVLGAELERFEAEFASFCEVSHVVGVASGLDALFMALRATGIGAGDEVIVPAHTAFPTWVAVAQAGARPVAVDVDAATMQIDPAAAAAALGERTRAVVPVHLCGAPVDVPVLREKLAAPELFVLADGAQAHGARLAGAPIAQLADATAFSFYPSKNLGAFGDGGALVTAQEALAARAQRLRNYGGDAERRFHEVGLNSRLDPLQAAFLRVKLARLPEWNARRAAVAKRYLDGLAGVDSLRLPAAHSGAVWHLFCVRHPRRDALREHLARHGVGTQIHYPVPPHLTDAFAHLGYARGAFPVAEAIAQTTLSLPIGPHLDAASVDRVIEAVRTFTH
jgi:dTDP-3-amino-3,4,6-trideoxy-alpha-D-glucose transaminase